MTDNSPNAQMPKNPNTVRLLMWTISSSWADFLFDVANVVLIVGAAIVLIGTIGSIKIAAIRDQFSNERISANEAATKKAIAESDVAKADAAKAQLALEKYKAPRILTGEQLHAIADKLRPLAGQAYDLSLPVMMEPGAGLHTELASRIWTGR
jgi:hypothetical protein